MSTNVKGFIFITAFFAVAISIFIFKGCQDGKQGDEEQKKRLAMVDSISFKGKVINSKNYQYGGKNYYMICIKLDYSNIKSCYILNDLCAIKIKDNIATMAAGFLNTDNGVVDSVEVNINHNRKERYKFKNGVVHEYNLSLVNMGLSETDMDYCN